MTNRQRMHAVLNYESYDRLPLVHFGFWEETVEKWVREGHIPAEEAGEWADGATGGASIRNRLGFDFCYDDAFVPNHYLSPAFDPVVLEEAPDGSRKVRSAEGVTLLEKAGVRSIPAEFDHLLKDRKSWEEHYLPRLQFSPQRVTAAHVYTPDTKLRWDEGGSAFLRRGERDYWYGLYCGSLFGVIRNMLGVVGASYLYAEDPELFREIIDRVGNLCFEGTKTALASGAQFDFGHFWEDICFRGGPLVIPSVFAEMVGPHYRRITDLLSQHGIRIVSLDCDGCIDALIPAWLNNGVNTMFPIEVGVWNASIAPWRDRYGRELRGVGGMDKRVFAQDRAAVEREIERLKPLVALGGYVPCPDHRIPPDAEWDNVRYYCDRVRAAFG